MAPRTLLLLFVLGAAVSSTAVRHPLDYLQSAEEAYRGSDRVAFHQNTLAAARLAPDYPPALYSLARAQALMGDVAAAFHSLDEVARLGGIVASGAAQEKDFASLHADKRWPVLLAKIDEMRAPLARSAVAFRLTERDLIPEGITYDPVSRRIFVGSTYKRKIVSISLDGAVGTFVDGTTDGLLAVGGLKVDARRRVLWVATGSGPNPVGRFLHAQEGDRWRTGVFKYHLDTGKLIAKYMLNGNSGEHFFNDLAITSADDAYVTDTQTGSVYVIRAGKQTPEVFLGPEAGLRFANGITLSPDERFLFVAHAVGTERIDLRTGKRQPLAHPPGMTLSGIDGLSFHRGTLLAHQNATLRSVNRYYLNSDWSRVTRKEVIDAFREEFDIPSTGSVAERDYYYIANAQLRSFTDGRIWPHERLRDVIILKFTL